MTKRKPRAKPVAKPAMMNNVVAHAHTLDDTGIFRRRKKIPGSAKPVTHEQALDGLRRLVETPDYARQWGDLLDRIAAEAERVFRDLVHQERKSDLDQEHVSMQVLDLARSLQTAGGDASLLLDAFRLGRLVVKADVLPLEPDAKAGRRVRKGGKTGHYIAHGDDDDKRVRWEAYRTAYAEQLAKCDGQIGLAKRKAGEQFGVHAKTIGRALDRR